MPRNGTGTFTLSQPAFVPGTTISSTSVNSDLSDIASGLTGSISADGQTTITGQLKFPSGTNAAPGIAFASALDTGVFFLSTKIIGITVGGTTSLFLDQNKVGTGQTGNQIYYGNAAILNPVGMVSDFAGSTAPTGWLLCFGQILTFVAYPELAALLTNTYGGDGVTTFGVPDCRGRVSAGKDDMGGSAASRITVAGGNFNGTTLGGTGGQQNKVIANGNLPASIPFTDTGHIHTQFGSVNSTDHAVLYTTGGSGLAIFDFNTGSANRSVSSTVTGITINAGGANTALPVLSPTIIFNKIIFAGRP